MSQTTQQKLVIERTEGEGQVRLVELTPLVSIAAVQPGTQYRLSVLGGLEDTRTRIQIEDIPSSKYYGYSSSIPMPYDGYSTKGLAQLVTLGPRDSLGIPRLHRDGATYIILVPYELEELWLSELKTILQARQGNTAVFGLIPESVLRKLSEGPPTERCSYFPSVYL